MLTVFSASAQDKKAEALKEVRALYAKALDNIKERDSECSECIDKITIKNEQMLGGTGKHEKTTTFYFDQNWDDGSGNGLRIEPKFFRVSYNYAARTYLEEYLYEDGKLVFAFIKENDYPAVETRVYIKNGITILDKRVTADTQTHPFNMLQVNSSNEDVQKAVNNAKNLSNILKSVTTSY